MLLLQAKLIINCTAVKTDPSGLEATHTVQAFRGVTQWGREENLYYFADKVFLEWKLLHLSQISQKYVPYIYSHIHIFSTQPVNISWDNVLVSRRWQGVIQNSDVMALFSDVCINH